MEKKQQKEKVIRPPVVVIMGHVDHGKSTLLDYIRKTNIVDKEVGGITQRISAYEVVHKDESGADKKITFLDTPGHEAFSKIRERGAQLADIAILVVSAEDGVKPQTIEAWNTIEESELPVIVAINKIDKPGANIEKTKMELAENEIYLENYGGKTPVAEISAKVGTGVDNLLSLILLLAEMENFTGNPSEHASGFVLEAHLDPKRGTEATLLIKNGRLKSGMTIVVEDALAGTRIMENFQGEMIREATFSSPIRIIGFDKLPRVGAPFVAYEKKKDAEEAVKTWRMAQQKVGSGQSRNPEDNQDKKIISIVLKADVAGSLEAIEKEISKIKNKSGIDNTEFKIITKGVGPIALSDIKSLATGKDALVVGFNVKADRSAIEEAEKRSISVSFFDIIYKLTEWLEGEMERLRLKVETTETNGRIKILRAFSRTKERQILGGKVTEGLIKLGSTVKIMRREFEIGRGKIVNLEKNKTKVSEVEEGAEFGMMLESKLEIVPSDVLESFSIVER